MAWACDAAPTETSTAVLRPWKGSGRGLDGRFYAYYNRIMSAHNNMHRLTITMPADLAEWLRHKANKSGFIAEAVREKRARDERAKRQEALGRAYRDAAREGAAIAKDWDAL